MLVLSIQKIFRAVLILLAKRYRNYPTILTLSFHSETNHLLTTEALLFNVCITYTIVFKLFSPTNLSLKCQLLIVMYAVKSSGKTKGFYPVAHANVSPISNAHA